MAKGDKAKVQNSIDSQYGRAQNELENYRQNELLQNQADQNRYSRVADWTERQLPEQMGQWQNFATTGGFSPEDIANIRARSVSPIRAMYSNALANLTRQKALTGGYSPNAPAAYAQMMRQQSANAADASTNAEAMIAELLQRGKLSGLQGMNQLYGETPGAMATAGNIRNVTNQQLLGYQGLQNDIAKNRVGAQLGASQVPGNFQQALGNIGGTMKLIGAGAGMLSGIPGAGAIAPSGGSMPSMGYPQDIYEGMSSHGG
jgi:hypothetical protein